MIENAILKARIIRTYLETYKKTKDPGLLDALYRCESGRYKGFVQELQDLVDALASEASRKDTP